MWRHLTGETRSRYYSKHMSIRVCKKKRQEKKKKKKEKKGRKKEKRKKKKYI